MEENLLPGRFIWYAVSYENQRPGSDASRIRLFFDDPPDSPGRIFYGCLLAGGKGNDYLSVFITKDGFGGVFEVGNEPSRIQIAADEHLISTDEFLALESARGLYGAMMKGRRGVWKARLKELYGGFSRFGTWWIWGERAVGVPTVAGLPAYIAAAELVREAERITKDHNTSAGDEVRSSCTPAARRAPMLTFFL